MKKYDFYLVVLYVFPVVLCLMILCGFKRMEKRKLAEGVRYFEEIYRTPVKTVVLRHPHVEVNRTGKEGCRTENGLEFVGNLDVKYLDCFKVSDDSLVISGDRRQFVLQLNVDTTKAPMLKIERWQTESERNQDGI